MRAVRACVARITLCIISRRALIHSITHGTHSYSRTLMVTQIRSELKSTVYLWPSRAFSPDLPRCSVVHTNLLVVRQPAVNRFVFRESRSPATAIDSEVSKSRERRFKIEILSIQTCSNVNFCFCCKFQRLVFSD